LVIYKNCVFGADRKSNMVARAYNVFWLVEILKIFLLETTKPIELWLCRNDHWVVYVRWWLPSWMEVGVTGHTFESWPPKDHSSHVCFKLTYWFQRRRLQKFKMAAMTRLSLTLDPMGISHFHLFFWNHKTDLNQTWQKCSLDGHMPSLIQICFVVSEKKMKMWNSHRVLC
jgi:hypothetical protein